MKFLDGKYYSPSKDETITSKRKRDCKSQRTENEISSYFNPSKRRLRDIKSDTMTTPSYNCTEPRTQHRQESHSPGVRSPELLVYASPGRPSPRSAMAEVLRRKGVYSLPANLSSHKSNSSSNSVQASVAGGDSGGDFDDHSEYSREGFQTRFRADVRGPADLSKGRNHEIITRPSIDSHIELIKNNDCRSEEEFTNTKANGVEKNTKYTKQVPDTPEPIVMAKKTQGFRGRCTPEPFRVREVNPTEESSIPRDLRLTEIL